jgi:CRP/FNR family transcriptional regulator
VPSSGSVKKSLVDSAAAKSILAGMPARARATLVSGGAEVRLRSKAYFVRSGDPPRCALVMDGLVRTFRVAADGRELTLHWERAGEVAGLSAVVRPPTPSSIQAVTDAIVLELPVPLLRDLARTDAKVAWAITEHMTALLRRAVDEIVLYAYGDLRTRVGRRLLEFACKTAPGTPLVARLTQDDLAQAVGAARPSVGRVLKALRDEGSIRSMYGGVLILRPDALASPRSEVA